MNKFDLSAAIKTWGAELGFQQVGITDTNLDDDEIHLLNWLNRGWHGEMAYMESHGRNRSRPVDLVPGTVSVISVTMNYFPPSSSHPRQVLNKPELAYISRYAVGRDYHKLMRRRLQRLATKINDEYGSFGYRCFVDSAPVLEKALARNAGLGWIGKHSNLINPGAGSWFFIGEIYTDLPLVADPPFTAEHCGTCNACIDICPTRAIVGPKQVDARRCISYLTIELRSAIPVEFRKLIGNRVYGCDDCQLICPWNKFSNNSEEDDFRVRHGLDLPALIELFSWDETEFLNKTEGSAIRRIGYECWLRNLAVGLGNAPGNNETISALLKRKEYPSPMVREHVGWALAQHRVSVN